MRAFGRFLQKMGLVIPPLSLVAQLIANSRGPASVSPMLLLLGFSVALFGIGYILEAYASGADR